MPACHRCGTAFEAAGIVSRGAVCSSCHAALKSCRNCELHDARAKNECREPHAEPVSDKTASNFCELYEPNRRTATTTASSSANTKKPSDDAFAALFKK